jgi:hypothetical protein
MCGSVSAIGLEDAERRLWPHLRERLRVPGKLMALMRGVLGDAEVAAVVAVAPDGTVKPLAILTTAEPIMQEISLVPQERRPAGAPADIAAARIGDDDVQVLLDDARRPGEQSWPGITFFESEEEMRRGDEALNEMTPQGGGRRTGVEFYEVGLDLDTA